MFMTNSLQRVHLLLELNHNVLKCFDNELQNSNYSRQRLTNFAGERMLLHQWWTRMLY